MKSDTHVEDLGWKVLRQRQGSLEKLLLQAIRTRHEADGWVHLLDLALGSGRHVLEVVRSLPELNITATLKDADAANLQAGRQLANQLGLTRLDFAVGDAFDEDELGSLEPAPNVVLAAGIYELAADSSRVLHSLRGLAKGMHPGGLLVYTDQPHHPRLEMIGRVAVPRGESPWVMRRRTPEELEALLHQASFSPLTSEVDEEGLFTVGLAQLPG